MKLTVTINLTGRERIHAAQLLEILANDLRDQSAYAPCFEQAEHNAYCTQPYHERALTELTTLHAPPATILAWQTDELTIPTKDQPQ